MSAILTETHNLQPETETNPVRQDAFYLDSQGAPLFAWLHSREDRQSLDHGVIICAPVGYEQLHSHRTLRRLADAVARTGMPTLRFDWHGTGDSAGVDEDENRCATWQANLRDACAWMRRETGCQRISIIGLRLGATIAAVTSADLDVDHFVLWAPVTNGRAFAREMLAIDMTSEFRPAPNAAATGNVEAAGFTLSRATATELGAWNLLKANPTCRRALLVMRDDLPEDRRLHDAYRTAGIEVEQLSVPGHLEMMSEPHRSRVPATAIEQITRWLETHILPEHSVEVRSAVTPHRTTTAALSYHGEAADPTAAERQIRERAVRISTIPDLFGIVSEPLSRAAPDNSEQPGLLASPALPNATLSEEVPTIVLLNAGSSYRVGPGRLNVHIARHLSTAGFRCVRIDVNGLGDSRAIDLERENETYPSTVFRDVELTLDYLLQELGVTRCVLVGLCSGAYASFQSAARLKHPLLIESVLINPLTFFWKDGMTLDTSPVRDLRSQHYYLKSALQPKKWLKLLSGKSNIGFSGAVRILARKLGLAKPTQPHVNDGDDADTERAYCGAVSSHPQKDDLPADLANLIAADRRLAMFFATSDPGYSILMHKAKSAVNCLRRTGELQITFINDADHTFSRRHARSALVEALSGHLCDLYLY